MRRYVSRKPRSADLEYYPDGEDYLSRTVYEKDDTPQFTGLYDADGNELCSVNEIGHLGYLKFK